MQVILTLQIGCTECTLLAVMSCNRHVAVCKPLYYSAIMTQQLCLQLALGSWASGFLVSLIEYCCFPSSLWRSEHSQTLILWTSCFFKGGFRRYLQHRNGHLCNGHSEPLSTCFLHPHLNWNIISTVIQMQSGEGRLFNLWFPSHYCPLLWVWNI